MADAVGVDPTLARFGGVLPCRGSAGIYVAVRVGLEPTPKSFKGSHAALHQRTRW